MSRKIVSLTHTCGREMEHLGKYRKSVTFDAKGNVVSGCLLLDWWICVNCPTAVGKAKHRMVGI